MNKQTKWSDVKVATPLTPDGQAAYDAEARIAAFCGLVHRLRIDAGLTQADLAMRNGYHAVRNRPHGSRRCPTDP